MVGRDGMRKVYRSIRYVEFPQFLTGFFIGWKAPKILEVLFRDSLKGKGISLPNLFKVFYLQFYRIIKRSGKQESSDFAAERL